MARSVAFAVVGLRPGIAGSVAIAEEHDDLAQLRAYARRLPMDGSTASMSSCGHSLTLATAASYCRRSAGVVDASHISRLVTRDDFFGLSMPGQRWHD